MGFGLGVQVGPVRDRNTKSRVMEGLVLHQPTEQALKFPKA